MQFADVVRSLFRAMVIISALLIVSSCVADKEEPAWSLQPGDACPDFEITTNTGLKITSQALRGKKTLIVFFNTSCSDCQRELPVIQQIADATESDQNVNVICIAREETAASIQAYWAENNLTMPFSPQPDRAIYNLFATSIIPRAYIIDATLTVTAVWAEQLPPAQSIIDNLIDI